MIRHGLPYTPWVAMVTIVGCALRSQMIRSSAQEAANEWIGQPSSALVAARGEPTYRVPLPDGEELWTYETVEASSEDPPIDRELIEPDDHELQKRLSSWQRRVTFHIDINGLVTAAEVEVE